MNEAATILSFSERLIKVQRGVRVLEAIRFTDDIQATFLANRGNKLPKVDRDYYRGRPLGFSPEETRAAFDDLKRDVATTLGADHPAGAILLRMCGEYTDTVTMLEHRGHPEFSRLSRTLYGSTTDTLSPGGPTLADFGEQTRAALDRIQPCLNTEDPQDTHDILGGDAADILQKRLTTSMPCHGDHVTVVADDGITADAAAGADVIKLRLDAKFSQRQLKLLEVHEGWVHVGTTLNGRAQSVCRFLNKGTPSATVTQEGLAVLAEVVSLVSSPMRQRRINNRVLAVAMAEDDADFIEVYRFFVDQGSTPADSFGFASRVFRGSTPQGSPFTKDLAYTKGFILLYNFLRAAVDTGQFDLIPLIFCGKTVLDDIGHLQQLSRKGLLEAPAFVPPPFADLHGLAAWMCYENVLSALGSKPLQDTYAALFQDTP